VVELKLRVLFRHKLGDGLSPQSRSSEDVGLVDGKDGERGVGSKGDLSGDSGDSLDLGDGVDGLVPCDTLLIGLLSVSKVCASGCCNEREERSEGEMDNSTYKHHQSALERR
jgi:hypothetical protein